MKPKASDPGASKYQTNLQSFMKKKAVVPKKPADEPPDVNEENSSAPKDARKPKPKSTNKKS
jgi:hypothetical protein